jgi:protein involved in polysaccharide export with SLBB domain
MKLQCTWLVRVLLIGSLPFAGIIFSGCSGVSGNPEFSDTNSSSAMTGLSATNFTDPEVARFHVGDAIEIAFTDLPEEQPIHSEAIKEDGTITLPIIGKVQAVGKTAGELQNEIHDLYVPAIYTHLTVTVSSGERVYYVRGEVGSKGSQLYRSEITVSRAITAAGDFDDFAKHKVILIRANGQRIKVDVDKVLKGEAEDPQVYPGDQIVVPRRLW